MRRNLMMGGGAAALALVLGMAGATSAPAQGVVCAKETGGVAVPGGAQATNVTDVACGTDSTQATGGNSTAMGAGALANGAYSSAFGGLDATSPIGVTKAAGERTTAIGAGAYAFGIGSSAIGNGAYSLADNSVALGGGSLADEENTVSVGNSLTGEFRKISNVAAGTLNNDAVNMFQFNTAVNSLSNFIIQEQIARASGDNVLTNALNVEIADRFANDVAIIGAINAEATTRDVADNILQTNINNEAVERALGDLKIHNEVVAEQTAREDADKLLSIAIDTEREERIAADVVLQDNIDKEAATRAAADVIHTNDISAINLRLNDTTVRIGLGATVGAEAVAIGHNAVASANAVSVGKGNIANGTGAVAIGDPNTATGTGAVALGNDNTANGQGAVALGNLSSATGEGSVAIGDASIAIAGGVALGNGATNGGKNNSVALGSGSANTADNQVHVGNRTIGGVVAGVADTDAVNVKQMKDFVASQGIGALQSQIGNLQTQVDNLAEENRIQNRAIHKGFEGVAMALAMESPAVPAGATFAISGGVGGYNGRHSLATAISAAIGEKASVSAGFGYGLNSGEVGYRAGFQVAF